MSTQLEINGINFLPIKEAAKSVSYTKDYVSRLAREKKIVATQIGRQWFIDLVSLQSFAETSKLEQAVRKQQLSLERKREQVVKQESKILKDEISDKIQSLGFRAQLVSVMILGFGLVAGVGIHTSSSIFQSQLATVAHRKEVNARHLAEVASVVPVKEVAYSVAEPQPTTMFNSVVEYPVFTNESETRAMSIGDTEGIFLMGRDSEIQTASEVESLFSDEVKVEFNDGSTGVVTYTKPNGEEVKYPFVSVPTNSKSERGVVEETI